MQLQRTCHSTHLTSTDDGTGAHSGVQPNTVSAGLLQRCVAQCSSQQHSEATARAEHRGTNRSASSATVTISTTAGTVTLATSSSAHQLEVRHSHVQDPQHINSGLTQPSHQTSGIYTSSLFFTILLLHRQTIRTHFAGRTCSASAIWNSLNADTLCSISLALFKRSLETFLFHQTFRSSSNCITPI